MDVKIFLLFRLIRAVVISLSYSTAALTINMASVSSDVPVVLRVKRKRTEDPADALGEPLAFIDCKERSRGVSLYSHIHH